MKRPRLSKEELRRIDIVSEYGGILPQSEAFYIHSVFYCASRAQEAFKRYDKSLANQSAAPMVVSNVHEALSHAASLSRFFWPSERGKLHTERSKKLRTVFQISENSNLKNRDLRNALEHFDERLDRYLLEHDAGHFFPSPIVDSHSLADEPTAKIFKLIDPAENVFVILNEKFWFSKIRMEVEVVLEMAESFDQNGSRFPR